MLAVRSGLGTNEGCAIHCGVHRFPAWRTTFDRSWRAGISGLTCDEGPGDHESFLS